MGEKRSIGGTEDWETPRRTEREDEVLVTGGRIYVKNSVRPSEYLVSSPGLERGYHAQEVVPSAGLTVVPFLVDPPEGVSTVPCTPGLS